LSSNLSAIGSWHLGGQRTNFDSGYYDYDYDYDYDDYGYEEEYYSSSNMPLDSFLMLNQLAGGVRYSFHFKRWLHPYVTFQAELTHGYMILADDIEEERERRDFDIHSQGLSVSGIGSFGVELTTKKKVAGLGRLSTYLESGYTDGSNLNFSYDAGVKGAEDIELGHVDLSGGYFRWGIGMRF
jgi:hypothetical protein